MDCRKTLVLALCLGGGGLGCVGQGTMPVPPAATVPPAEAVKEKELPKRQPRAATCVAFGGFREREAALPDRPPAEAQQLRDEARKAYQQALQIDPNYLPAYTALAHLYLDQNDYDRALATYNKALEKHAKEASLWFERGNCHGRMKNWDAALADLGKAVEIDPEDRKHVRTLGFYLARAGRYDESFTVFARLSGPAEAHFRLAQMLHHLQQDELSKHHLRQALQAQPDHTAARDLLASLDAGPAAGSVAAAGSEPGDETP